ncbi:tight adherence protein G [Actinobacillus equuli]|nr:tight adherence protein G [Actinobacillus equuli]
MNSLFSQESNDKNRIAVSPFALGAEYSATECTLPLFLTIIQELLVIQIASVKNNKKYARYYQRVSNYTRILKFKII